MRVSVIPSDAIVLVDGVGKTFTFSFPANMHALQWYGSHGEIEWKDKGQEYFDDPAVVQPYIDAWSAA